MVVTRPSVRAATLLVACAALLGGCDRGKDAEPRTAEPGRGTPSPTASAADRPAPDGTGVTILMDPSSKGVKVEGAPPLQGDPKDCAAFRACCQHPDASLFCGLLQATPDKPTCAQAVQKVKQFLKERGASPPAGC